MNTELVPHWQTVPANLFSDATLDSSKAVNISTLLKALLFLHFVRWIFNNTNNFF